jgi:hypothetical protein
MNRHADVSRCRPATPWSGHACVFFRSAAWALLAMLSLPFTAAAERAPAKAEYSYEEELRVEMTCLDGEKVRACMDAAGETQYECVRGPLSRFWTALFGRGEDDEVRPPTVVREERVAAPDDAGEVEKRTGERAEAETETSRDGKRVAERKVIVRKGDGDLPACRKRG